MISVLHPLRLKFQRETLINYVKPPGMFGKDHGKEKKISCNRIRLLWQQILLI